MKSTHIICRSALGVDRTGVRNEYTSGSWTVSPSEADALIGGTIFLHESKNEPSYFGGTVLGWFWSKRDAGAIDTGITFRLILEREAKGVPWQGADHSMAWFSGVLDQ